MYIYCITNTINNKQYVGLTTRDLDESKNYYGSGIYINRSIKKYGKENFNKEILEICDTDSQLKKREMFWITELSTKSPNGYNLTDGGDGVLNPTQEIIDKRNEKLKLLVGEKNSHYGMKHSDSSKQQISMSLMGKSKSKQMKNRLSKTLTGRKLSKETKEKMSMSRNNRTPEQLLKQYKKWYITRFSKSPTTEQLAEKLKYYKER